MSLFLVTGGAGFIGSHLCHDLLRDGHRVRVLDDLSTGRRDNLPSDGVEFMRGDIADPEAAASATAGIDGCFHLAAIASVERGMQDWVGSHRANLTGTIVLMDAMRRDCARDRSAGRRAVPFVYASSAAVYGDNDALPLRETAEKRPLSAYGADKYACELHAAVASRAFAIPTLGLRFFNVYGPRQDPKSPYSGVISIFCDRLLHGGDVTVFGDGEQTRDFVYVAQVVQALRGAMAAADAAQPRVLNVCTGVPVSVNVLLDTIATLVGRAAAPVFQPPRAGEIRHSIGAPDCARRLLGLGEPVALRDGLAHVLDWMRGPSRA